MRGVGTFNSRSTGWVRPQEALGAPCEVGSHSMEMPADGGIHGRHWQCKHACCRYGVLIGRQYGGIAHPRPHAAPGGRTCPKISESQLNKFTCHRFGGPWWDVSDVGARRMRSMESISVRRYRQCPQQHVLPTTRRQRHHPGLVCASVESCRNGDRWRHVRVIRGLQARACLLWDLN